MSVLFNRTSSSNSRFFDYQFANRPLPQAPNSSSRPIARNTPDEVRSSKRERCGSNTSGFISMRTYSCESNTKRNSNSNILDGESRRGRMRSSTNPSIETTEMKFTDTKLSRNRLPALPCSSTDMTAAAKPFKEIAVTKTTRSITTKLGEARERKVDGGSSRNAKDIRSGEAQQGSDPPSPPKRSQSSKLRCQELLRKMNLRDAQNQEEYCEIADKEKQDESGENLLYKKYLRKMIDPYYSSQFAGQNFENSPGKKVRGRSSNPENFHANLFDYDEHYDRLSYNTRRRYDDTVERFMNSTKDSCFNRADNDFVFSRPTEEEKLRRSSTGRLFQLRKLKEKQNRRSMVVTKSPLASQSHSFVSDQSDSNHVNIRAQSFSHTPRVSSTRCGDMTPVIVVHEHDPLTSHHKNPRETSTNQQLPKSHQYQHLRFKHSDTSPQFNQICAKKIQEERISDADETHTQNTMADHSDFEKTQLKLPYSKHHTSKGEFSDSSQPPASDKEELEELKSLVQSILRSEKGDSNPVSRADSLKDDSCVSRSNSKCGSQSAYLATPCRTILNLSSEIDLTESDDAGYLSPLTTLRKRNDVEEEEIFGEIQIQHRSQHRNKRGSPKHKKAIPGQRKTRKTSSNTPASNPKSHYSSSESDDEYDSIPRKRISKPPRHFQRPPVNRIPSETENSTVYMSIIDNDDPIIPTTPDTANSNETTAAFHSREREIYINASLSQDAVENCYEEIYSRQNSINPQQKPTTHKPYFCARKTKRSPEENYYQEVAKIPSKKNRNKRLKSKFRISSDQTIV